MNCELMTNDYVYNKKISKVEALKEIKNNAGSQFDPEESQIFIELMST